MNFTSNRKITLSGGGHVVSFDKGESKFLPPSLHQEALMQGLEADVGDEDAPTLDPAPDEAARTDAISAALKAIATRNNPDDFDASGTPKVKAIEALTGGHKPRDAKERQALWADVANNADK